MALTGHADGMALLTHHVTQLMVDPATSLDMYHYYHRPVAKQHPRPTSSAACAASTTHWLQQSLQVLAMLLQDLPTIHSYDRVDSPYNVHLAALNIYAILGNGPKAFMARFNAPYNLTT